MPCIHCGVGGIKPITQNFCNVKEWLLANGFQRTGGCACNGPQVDIYENGKGLRVDASVSGQAYWIKVKQPILYATVSYGQAANFENDIAKYL